MLVNVKDLFSKKHDHEGFRIETEPHSDPQTKDVSNSKHKPMRRLLAFNGYLIEDLENDHNLLLCNYEKLMECARENNFLLLSRLLGDFTVLITNHLHKEDDELYGYLENMAKLKNETEVKVFRQFRSEMKNISVTIFSTINQNPNIPVTSDTVEGFIADFTELGEILTERIQREESILYPMYTKSKKVVNIS